MAFNGFSSWLALGVFAAVAACTPNVGTRSESSTGASPPAVGASNKPAPEEDAQPLSNELSLLRQAVESTDALALQGLLSPSGVLCGDYLYGRTEFEMLLERPSGGLRPWVFGTGEKKRRSVRAYLEAGPPIVKAQSADHRSAEYLYEGGSLYIGFSLRNGRWLITEGLFCE